MAKNGIHTVFGLYLLSFQSVFVYFGRREMNGSDLLISKVTSESEIACPYQKLSSFEDEAKISDLQLLAGWLVSEDGTASEIPDLSLVRQGASSRKCPISTRFQTIITLDPDLRS